MSDQIRTVGPHIADPPSQGQCPARYGAGTVTLVCDRPPGHKLPHREPGAYPRRWYGPPVGPTPTLDQIAEHISGAIAREVLQLLGVVEQACADGQAVTV